MSRVIVKNLPKYLDDDRFRSHFSLKGEITDAKLIFTKDGKFRRFGYIGFKSENDARETVAYFDKSYIDTSRVEVQLARAIGDPSLPRAWSKYSRGSSAYARENEEEFGSNDEQRKCTMDDPAHKQDRKQKLLDALFAAKNGTNEKLQAYLQTFGSRQLSKTWANDEGVASSDISKVPTVNGAKGQLSKNNDDDEYQDLPKPAESESLELASLNETDKKLLEETVGPDDASLVAETGRLFVRNVPFSATESELKAHFDSFGPIAEIHFPVDKITKHTRGFAFILYVFPEHALTAYAALNHSIFQGRILDIVPGKEKLDHQEGDADAEGLSYKEKKALKERKQGAVTWNSLFMNSDAVAEAIARKLGVSKSELLNPEAENMAVKLALAETQIIQEVKAHLESQGVNLNAFEQSPVRMKRSSRVIIAKNIPHSVELGEITRLFSEYGALGRVIMPPTRSIAIVEFADEGEAKMAFKKLYMRKLHHLPLKLEWAPSSALGKEPAESRTDKPQETEAEPESNTAEKDAEQSDTLRLPSVSVFVKNISFSSSDDSLKRAFATCPGYRSARIVTKTKKDGTKLSTGFGFVEFNDVSTAKRAVESMQGYSLDNHSLELKLSYNLKAANSDLSSASSGAAADAGNQAESEGTKIAIRNIPFEANEKEIRALFHPFGQIKSVRLPKKGNRELRGFGFVSYHTKTEAKAAFDALAHTHLYGRRLVLEWAEDEKSLQELRKRTAASVELGDLRPLSKKIKVPTAAGQTDASDEEDDDM